MNNIHGTSQEAPHRYAHHRTKSVQPIQGGRHHLQTMEKLVPSDAS